MTKILWNQHNVGDAGFRGEQSFRAFTKKTLGAPWIYTGFIAGTTQAEAVRELAEQDVFIRIEHDGVADEYYAIDGKITCRSLGERV